MSVVILKGTDKKIECTTNQCDTINKMKTDGADPTTKVNVGGVVMDLGDIRYAIPDSEDEILKKKKEIAKEKSQRDFGDMISRYHKDFHEEIRRYALGSLQGKIYFNMEIAKMYAFAMTGSKNVEYCAEQLIAIFTEELKTEKLVVNPTKYIRLFTVNEVKNIHGLNSMEYLIRGTPFRFLDRYLSNVIHEIKKI